MARFLYKPLGLFFSVLGGLVAGAIFKRVWKSVASEEDAPNATDADKGWGEILAAATVQGAVFGGVKAADRPGRRDRLRAPHRCVARDEQRLSPVSPARRCRGPRRA